MPASKKFDYQVVITGTALRSETVKLPCKSPDCKRTSLEVFLDANQKPVLRIKNRHDGGVHVSDFTVEEIWKRLSELYPNS